MRSCCQVCSPVSWRSAASAFSSCGVGRHVAADFFGGAGGDVLVAGDDRIARAALERQERDESVHQQRRDRRAGEKQREPCRDVPDSQGHVPACLSDGRFVGPPRAGFQQMKARQHIGVGFDGHREAACSPRGRARATPETPPAGRRRSPARTPRRRPCTHGRRQRDGCDRARRRPPCCCSGRS